MTKHPSVSFIPNGLRDKYDERGQSLPVGVTVVGSFVPPFEDGLVHVPLGRTHVRETKQLNESLP